LDKILSRATGKSCQGREALKVTKSENSKVKVVENGSIWNEADLKLVQGLNLTR
jgi:hypothetical protein